MISKKTIIIAEAGVNHDGKIAKAIKLIKAAKKCKADYVKFQAFDANLLCTKNAEKANYQKKSSSKESQLAMLKRLALKEKDILKLNVFCKKIDIGLMFSVFDEKSYRHIKKLNHKFIKIPSGEINNFPLLQSFVKDKTSIIFSTGLSNLEEIKFFYKILIKKKETITNYANALQYRVSNSNS